jgi:hydroxybutyrate-dimer hydrolase
MPKTVLNSVKENAALDERYDRRESKRGEPYFVLLAANSRVIGQSEMYSSVAAMENGIISSKTNAPGASVDDLTKEAMETVSVNLDFIMDKVAYRKVCDGQKDDLLSGGLGKFGLHKDAFGKKDIAENPIERWEKAPHFDKSDEPTPDELRRRAIYNNYRALVDMSTSHPTAYYGEIYGPGVDFGGGEGLIAGEEYLALTEHRVTLMVQIPSTFDVNNPCIITAPSSGSRGIYGAIGTAGEWGLKRGFAVAYTDKGSGMGVHNLMTDTVNLVTGERCKATDSGNKSNFIAISEDDEKRKKILEEFNDEFENRVAFKHAHSCNNPEKDWGKYVLQSIKFAVYILNLKYAPQGKRFTAKNTLVIASNVSNGGGASLRAAEQDTEGWIKGVAVAEPNICPSYNDSFSIVQGESEPFKNHSKNLLDYMTLLNIYGPCACLAPELESAPLNYWQQYPNLQELAKNRCASLRNKGLLKSDGHENQSKEALKIINDYGILPEANILLPSHHFFDLYRSISVTFANQYGQFDVTENLCGYSFGATEPWLPDGGKKGKPIPLTDEQEARLFSDHNGIPPYNSVNLINNDSVGGPTEDRYSTSPSTQIQDQNLDGALRLRELLSASKKCENGERVCKGIQEVRASGNLHGLPAIIVTGRADAVIAPNHASRAYFGLNRVVESGKSNLHYYEITNAHHLDTMNSLYSKSGHYFAPLHYYFTQALDLMYDHLTKGGLLPESQVIRTNPPIMKLTEISKSPGEKERICFEDGCVKIPE